MPGRVRKTGKMAADDADGPVAALLRDGLDAPPAEAAAAPIMLQAPSVNTSWDASAERSALRDNLNAYLTREATAYSGKENAWRHTQGEKSQLAATQAKLLREAEELKRREELQHVAKRERDGREQERARATDEREAALGSLAATLETHFVKLGDDEAKAARRHEELKARNAEAQSKLEEVAQADLQRRQAAAWLREEMVRTELEREEREAAIAATEHVLRDELDRAAAERDAADASSTAAEGRHATATVREDACFDREEMVARRELGMDAMEAYLAAREAFAADDERARNTLARDVDARAHAIAAADTLSKQRLDALGTKAEQLAETRDELEALALNADERSRIASERERLAQQAEKRAHEEQARARALLERAEAKRNEAEQALEDALREAARKAEEALEKRKALDREAELERRRLLELAEAKRRELERQYAEDLRKASDEAEQKRKALEQDILKRLDKVDELRREELDKVESERARLHDLARHGEEQRKEMMKDCADRAKDVSAREERVRTQKPRIITQTVQHQKAPSVGAFGGYTPGASPPPSYGAQPTPAADPFAVADPYDVAEAKAEDLYTGATQAVKPRIGLGALARLGGAASRARKATAKKAKEAEEKAKKEAADAAAKEARAKQEAEDAAAREVQAQKAAAEALKAEAQAKQDALEAAKAEETAKREAAAAAAAEERAQREREEAAARLEELKRQEADAAKIKEAEDLARQAIKREKEMEALLKAAEEKEKAAQAASDEADRVAAATAEAERLAKEAAAKEAKASDEADRLMREATEASDAADKEAEEAKEKADEAEDAVEQEGAGEGALPAARNIGLSAVASLGAVQRSSQGPTSPYAGAEAYTLAYSGAPPSQILAGAPPPLPPPVRNPTGPTSTRENALEARELALEERLRYVEAMLAAKTRMEGSVSRGASNRHPWIEGRKAEPPAPGNDAGAVVAWCRSVGEALNQQQLQAHDAVKHAHHQIKATAAPATGGNAWALLPRDVRHALRDSVSVGDAVRIAVADLQAVLVRRFLRLCSAKDGHEEPDPALKDALRVVRGAASREVVRRKALCAALHDAQYKASEGVLTRIKGRAPSSSVARDLFRLRKNRFDALRLRTPAAKARFAAATAKWSSAEFRRLLRQVALQFNGDGARAFPGGGASSLEPGVFYGFEDAAQAHAPAPRVECRFDDDGDDGGHANRAALVFGNPKDLVECFEALENDGRLDIVAVSNGFLGSLKIKGLDENTKPTSAPHEVALAVDLLRQGILCDVRLRLRALERPQRHLGSLAFLADASTHEEILLPIWPDVCHYDGWTPHISARDRAPTVAKSVDFAPRDYRKPARWGQTN